MPPSLKPHVLISPTAYKGTLSPNEAARIMASAVRRAWPSATLILHPLADGGDGTLEVLNACFHGQLQRARVTGPLRKKVTARWALIQDKKYFKNKTAVIEMAEASGLKLLQGPNRIREASSYGTGELIRAALDAGCKTILIGVGGTACSDGGAGALQALGLKYFDGQRKELSATPQHLISLKVLDKSGLDSRLKKTSIYILCDVTNPLLGKSGSARIFGPQKGANVVDVLFLEKFFKHWTTFSFRDTKNEQGAGAAGGIAFGLSAFVGARLVKGTSFIMNATKWNARAKNADVILTGEGKLDATSFAGKVIGEIVKRKKIAAVYVACGATTFSKKEISRRGLASMTTLGSDGMINPRVALKRATEKIFLK